MRPPDRDGLPLVFHAREKPSPDRDQIMPAGRFFNAASIVAAFVFALPSLLFLALGEDAETVGGLAFGGAVTWLVVACRLFEEPSVAAVVEASERAAFAIPQETIERAILHDLGKLDPRYWSWRHRRCLDVHREAGRWFEALFWMRVVERSLPIVRGQPWLEPDEG